MLLHVLPSEQGNADVRHMAKTAAVPVLSENTRSAVTLTPPHPQPGCLVTSVTQRQEDGLGALRCDVYQREEKHGPDDLRGKGHL